MLQESQESSLMERTMHASRAGTQMVPIPVELGMSRKTLAITILCGLFWGASLVAQEAAQPRVVFVTGDDEYRSEITMPMIARILESQHSMKCAFAASKPTPQTKDNIEGLEALASADVAVFFLRAKTLPEDQFQRVLDYVESGRPVVGLRPSTHSFLYPKESPLAKWDYEFGREVFGQKWLKSHERTSSTDVTVIAEQAEHPILRGIKPKFHVRSWLYQVTPLHGNCVELLHGDAVKGDRLGGTIFGNRNPVAWTKQRTNGRTFFTTLGHPQDFEDESARRLVINGIYWALGKDVPAGGANVDLPKDYVTPPTGK
jgi:uncharacterized protein